MFFEAYYPWDIGHPHPDIKSKLKLNLLCRCDSKVFLVHEAPHFVQRVLFTDH